MIAHASLRKGTRERAIRMPFLRYLVVLLAGAGAAGAVVAGVPAWMINIIRQKSRALRRASITTSTSIGFRVII